MLKEPPPHDCDLWVTVIDRDFDTDWELAEHQLYLIIDIFLVLSQDSCVIFCKIHLFKYLNPEKAHCPLFSLSPVKVNPIWLNIVKHSGGWLPFLRTRIRARSHFRNLPGINPGASTAALVLKSDHFLLRIPVFWRRFIFSQSAQRSERTQHEITFGGGRFSFNYFEFALMILET